jgi:hypothetical protein
MFNCGGSPYSPDEISSPLYKLEKHVKQNTGGPSRMIFFPLTE